METIRHAYSSMQWYGVSALEVHVWLDQYWNGVEGDHSHRKILHNDDGVELGVAKFGEWARPHLLLHIYEDEVRK